MYHDDDDMIRRRTQRLDRLRRQREWDDELFDDVPTLRYRSRSTGSISPQLVFLVLLLLLVAVGGFWFMQRINELGSSVPSLQVIVQTPTPQIISGTAVVQRIQQLSRLETSKYTIERVIDIRQGSNIPIIGDWLAGDAILLIAHGTVIVGVDLSQLTTDDVIVSPDGQRITVRLPPVQVLSATLDNSKRASIAVSVASLRRKTPILKHWPGRLPNSRSCKPPVKMALWSKVRAMLKWPSVSFSV